MRSMILLCCVVGAVVIRERKETKAELAANPLSKAAKFAAENEGKATTKFCACGPEEQPLDMCVVDVPYEPTNWLEKKVAKIEKVFGGAEAIPEKGSSIKEGQGCGGGSDPVSGKKFKYEAVCIQEWCYDYDSLIATLEKTNTIPHTGKKFQWEGLKRVQERINQCTCGGNADVGSRCKAESTCYDYKSGPLIGQRVVDYMVPMYKINHQGAHVENGSGWSNEKGKINEPVCIDGMCYDRSGLGERLKTDGTIPHNGEKYTTSELNALWES